jgi:predicted ArsR family transcriptional regulator
MDNLDSCYKVVLQSSTKGISAIDISKKLNVHRTTIHKHLNSLELMGKVHNEHGLWYPKSGKQEYQVLNKEITIELPLPKEIWMETALMEVQAQLSERMKLPLYTGMIRTLLEKLKETRTITIRGKNVENFDLEKAQNLILQAYEKSSKVKAKGLPKLLKKLKLEKGE